MYFLDSNHEANFNAVLSRWPQGATNPEYRIACYILAHPEIYHKATRRNWEYPFDDWMEQEDFSHGVRLLIDLGFHLYGGGRHSFNLMDGLSTWDAKNYQVFVQACEIRKGRR